MSSVRLFVALPVPAHVRALVTAAVAPARDEARSLTWTRPEGWHVTLAFLGRVEEASVAAVSEVVGGAVAASAPLSCRIGDPGRFRREVLWLEVLDDPEGEIARLGRTIQTALSTAGHPVTEQPVRAHLTLARASRKGARIDDRSLGTLAPVSGTWDADEVQLVRSDLGDGPARYTPVASWPLGGRVA